MYVQHALSVQDWSSSQVLIFPILNKWDEKMLTNPIRLIRHMAAVYVNMIVFEK